MRRLVLLASARHDLVAIDAYVIRESGSVARARHFTDQLRSRCVRLANLPGTLGAARPDLGQGVRCVTHRNYLILFRYEPGILRVLRVLEGHRDIGRNPLPPEA